MLCIRSHIRSSMDCETVRDSRFSIVAGMFASFRALLDASGWLCVLPRNTHNRGVFSSTFAKNGVVIRPARLAGPEEIGRVERRGDMLKKMMSKVIKDTHASGRESMDMLLSRCLNAANEMIRHGGSLPAQWVFSRLPRSLAIGDDNECLDVGGSTSTC